MDRFDTFTIEIRPRHEVFAAYGFEATAKTAVIINGVDVTGVEGPDPATLLSPRGRAPKLDIEHHMWAATEATRTIPLGVGLAATRRDDVDLWVSITRTSEGVMWELRSRSGKSDTFCFDPGLYEKQLWNSLHDRSWEDHPARTLRMVREQCDHGLLKSRGLTWKWSGSAPGKLIILFDLAADPTSLIGFYPRIAGHGDPQEAVADVLEKLYEWAAKGAPGSRSRDSSLEPDTLESIRMYP